MINYTSSEVIKIFATCPITLSIGKALFSKRKKCIGDIYVIIFQCFIVKESNKVYEGKVCL